MSNAQKVSALIEEIRELNMAGADENGHRWANSDLIEQTCMEALNALRAAPTPDAHSEVMSERARQIAKGFDAAHDDQHVDREIICDPNWGAEVRLHRAKWTKDQAEYVAQLVQVAAMIVAEIERSGREMAND